MSELTCYEQHQLSANYPAMSAEDHAALTADIKRNGLHNAIVLFEGKIVDGFHRYRACLMAGVKPSFQNLPEGVDPVAFVESQNHHRRHSTPSQLAAAVVANRKWATAGNQPNMEPGSTLASMAKAADVSIKTIQHAKAAHSAGLGEAVRDGKITAKAAAVFAKTPRSWINEGGDQLVESCTMFEVTLQAVWDTRCVMGIDPELAMKIWRGEMETEEAKALVIKADLELARRVWSREVDVSLDEFTRLREADCSGAAWITDAVASKLTARTLLKENEGGAS